MKIVDIKKVKWKQYGNKPIITTPRGSAVIADPSLLTPEDSPDNLWHLFAHSLWGICHYHSKDGVTWSKPRLLFRHGMRAFIFKDNGLYYLFYEKYRPFQIMFSYIKSWKWKSQIEVRTSSDLKTWSKPKILIKPELQWHQDKRYGKSVSNPCLVKHNGTYMLYFSASLELVKDCGFNEPRYIGVATAESIKGPYTVHHKPLIEPSEQDQWCNIGAGSIKVLATDDGFIGFQNGIYWNNKTDHSGSAILVLSSKDGYKWDYLLDDPIIQPTTGWQRSHVYACDTKYIPEKKSWYLYYNARDDWHWTKGSEVIGLAIGT